MGPLIQALADPFFAAGVGCLVIAMIVAAVYAALR